MTTKTRVIGLRVLGPKGPPPYPYKACIACHKRFGPGDYTTLIPVGPGDNGEARVACREGRPYNERAVEVHYACATGEDWKP